MRFAVTPLLVVLGVVFLWHVIIAEQTAFDACINEDASAVFAKTAYWNNLRQTLGTPWAAVTFAILACAFLPFIFAAFFVRSQFRLRLQWGGMAFILCVAFVFFPWNWALEPGWCFGTELFSRPHVFYAGFVLVCLTLPVFLTITFFGLGKPKQDDG
jgi:hypothetical protein